MQPFSCVCGNRLFFENSACFSCKREAGWCPSCRSIHAIEPLGDGRYRCTGPGCGATLVKCANYEREQVCNRCVADDPTATAPRLCECCHFNETIPDLSIPGNYEKWWRLEAAKRRLFYTLDLLGLPYGTEADGIEPRLSFDFKADIIPQEGLWHPIADVERVFTGHAGGKITINIREADDVERERLRVDMGETHRTVLGHFRHEIGHYYWEMLVRGKCEEAFRAEFGDHENPSYGDALERYYADGPVADWALRYISAYASMHPWEDWAECFAHYLDMAGVLDTAVHWKLIDPPALREFDQMAADYRRIGVIVNELNREKGLLDLVPEVLTPPVLRKLAFVHRVVGARSIPHRAGMRQAEPEQAS